MNKRRILSLQALRGFSPSWTREGLDLPVKFELCAGDAIGVLGDYLKTNCTKQVGPERYDVAARVENLSVRVQSDGSRVMRRKCVDQGVFEARLMVDLIAQTSGRRRRVIDRCATEGVVEDQSPASSAFDVLSEPIGELVDVLKPAHFLVACKVLFIQL